MENVCTVTQIRLGEGGGGRGDTIGGGGVGEPRTGIIYTKLLLPLQASCVAWYQDVVAPTFFLEIGFRIGIQQH